MAALTAGMGPVSSGFRKIPHTTVIMWATSDRSTGIWHVDLVNGSSLSTPAALPQFNEGNTLYAVNDVRGFMEGGVLKYIIVVYKLHVTPLTPVPGV